MNIEWRAIKDYEGLYEVSNDGRVRRLKFINGKHSFDKIRECKQTLNTWGYMTVNLCKNGKSNTKRVHKLVANTFLGESDLQVDHIDGNKLNNKLENLEYVTPKENTNRAWEMGLSKNTAYQREIARKTMLKRWKNNNHRIWRGKKKTANNQFKAMEYEVK